ncbi:MAG: D-aminoacylase [Phycisphaerae bacterium]|nr:D-aminoacylase [Phycisphaerae bacterium]
MQNLSICVFVVALIVAGCGPSVTYDVLIRNGTVYDGSGGEPVLADVAINGDTIVGVGSMSDARGRTEIDAAGLAVAPGFINMLSWANASLLADGRSQSDIRQGVTLEVMGEGRSMGPLNDAMKKEMQERQVEVPFDVVWTTLGEYLEHLEKRGVSTNVASFVGNATVRTYVIGQEDRRATPAELEQMRALVEQAMQEGAMGVSSALIYTPSCFANTDELVALAEVAGEYGGIYISHIRNEGGGLLEAIEELITIAHRADVPAEIYHFKASGRTNWHKLDEAIARIEDARADGLRITADMYTYHASSTGLYAIMPPWVQEGGHAAWVERLKDPAVRARLKQEMSIDTTEWENDWVAVGEPRGILLVGFRNEALRPLTGKSLAEVAAMRGTSPEDTAMDLVIEDDSGVECVFFTMTEDNVRKKIRQSWMSFCSDGASMAPEGVFLNRSTHPRAYGSFARLLGKYVRDEQIIPLKEAIRRLSSLPASTLGLDRRGSLQPGYYADVVVFDPTTIRDNATYDRPHQYATGMHHVLVNGVPVLRDGEHTGAMPGRFVRGPGWTGGNPNGAARSSHEAGRQSQ